MTPILLIFDIDGTLIDGAGSGALAMEHAFAACFGVPEAGKDVPSTGRTDRAIFGDMAAAAGVTLDEAGYARLQAAYLQALPAAMTERGARALPGVPDLLATLATDPRCRLALGTGNIEGGARIKLAHFDLARHFPVGGFGAETAHRPTVIAAARTAAAAHYGIDFPVATTVVIGDAPLDVAAARANGMRILGVGTSRPGPGPVAIAGPDVLFPDLRDTRRIIAWLLD